MSIYRFPPDVTITVQHNNPRYWTGTIRVDDDGEVDVSTGEHSYGIIYLHREFQGCQPCSIFVPDDLLPGEYSIEVVPVVAHGL